MGSVVRSATGLLGVLTLCGCYVFDPDTPAPIPVDSTVLFQVIESYTRPTEPGLPRIALFMRTEREYGCSNWQILHATQRHDGRVSVDLRGIVSPPICLTSLGPASGQAFLDVGPGEYAFTFTKQSASDRYVVTVTERLVAVGPEDGSITDPSVQLYWRHPPNSFAYACGTMQETQWMCEDCLGRIRGAVALSEFQFPEPGLAPWPRQASGHWVDTPTRFFSYGSDADFQRAGDVLATYSRDVIHGHQGVGISLHSWKNEEVLSWLHDGNH